MHREERQRPSMNITSCWRCRGMEAMPSWGVGNCNPSGTELLAAAGGFYFHKA